MKALITGINGFVGKYLYDEVTQSNVQVIGTDLQCNKDLGNCEICDLTAAKQVRDLISRCRPDVIYHLAGQSNVGLSWKKPELTFNINVNGTINLLEAVRESCPEAHILIIGSSDQYGVIRPEDCPISEKQGLTPHSPYAISKAAQEQMAQLYVKSYHLYIVMTRSFNHIGPGQGLGFVTSDFASAIVEIERGRRTDMTVGNLDAKRDFTDVRDVVRAYRLLMEKGKAGEIYNVGSGQAIAISGLLDMMRSASVSDISVKTEREKLRPSDIPIIKADITKITRDTGWRPLIPLEDTVAATLDYWRGVIK